MTIAETIIAEMMAQKDDYQRENLMRFFKTQKGEYGYGDQFIGLKVPQTRQIVKKYYKLLNLSDLDLLLKNQYHEIRLCGFLILVEQFLSLLSTKKKADTLEQTIARDEIINKYLANLCFANNWDLVDMTSPKLLGKWYYLNSLIDFETKTSIIDTLASSQNLWERRVSMVFTWTTTRLNHPEVALKYARIHLNDKHDLMQKAVGWMLREVGKYCSEDLLREFLSDNYQQISRTTLRYAIEKFDDNERQYWLYKDKKN